MGSAALTLALSCAAALFSVDTPAPALARRYIALFLVELFILDPSMSVTCCAPHRPLIAHVSALGCWPRPSGPARSHLHYSGDGAGHRHGSRKERSRSRQFETILDVTAAADPKTTTALNWYGHTYRCKVDTLKKRAEQQPPPSHMHLLLSAPTAEAQPGDIAVVGSFIIFSKVVLSVYHARHQCWRLCLFGACDRSEDCLGILPLPPSSKGAPYKKGVKMQWMSCSWPLALLLQTARKHGLGSLLNGFFHETPAACTSPV